MEVSRANKEQVRFRMSDADLEPIRRACEAADLSLSAVIRETLVRHGLAVAIELAHSREFTAETAYAVTGKRQRRGEAGKRQDAGRKQMTLAGIVSYKYNVALPVAAKWIKLGRVSLGGVVQHDPDRIVKLDDAGSLTKHAAA